jgi:hypothetical protein
VSEHAELYVRLALRLARHDEGVVESYNGPPEMATGVDDEPLTAPIDLVAEAEGLLADLPDAWLRDQVAGLRARAGLLAGERWSYADEVEACFGVQPTLTDEATLHGAYERLEALLPGSGSLRERYQAWERATQVPTDRVPAVVDAVVEESRAHARRMFGLPEDEGFDVEYVSGEGWLAFHEYVGGLRAHVSVNTDLPRSGVELLHTVLHETYAGHHAESCLKEVALVRERGLLEQAIVVVPTPQSLVSEGLAELGPSLLLDGEHRARYEAIVRDAGVDIDLAHDRTVAAAVEPVLRIQADAGQLLHAEGWSEDAVLGYLRQWGLVDDTLLEHVVRFVADPANRGYVVCYPEGLVRCREYVKGDPARFTTLLTEQVRVGDLSASL